MSKIHRLKFLFLFAFAILALFAIFSSDKTSHLTLATSGGPPTGFTGAPDENNCAACHTDIPDTGQFTIEAPTNYAPGQTYPITVQNISSDMTRRRWGFQMTALAGSSGAGTFTNNNNLTQVLSDSGRSYIEHTAAGTFAGQQGGSSWTFRWTAPATNVGAITLYAAGNQADNDTTSDGDCILLANSVIQPMPIGFDFDGDRKSDIGIFRPAPAEWWYLRSSDGGNRAYQFGTSTDPIVPADFTGDGKTDIAFWRASDGYWIILRSEDLTFFAFPFGANGDTPVPADYDGDGKANAAVYRPSVQTWIIRIPNGAIFAQFGIAGDLPAIADYDGDGKADIAIFRPSVGEWWIQRSTTGVIAFQFGNGTDKVVPGDYTGDGKADVTFWRPSTGFWYVLRSEDFSFFAVPFGTNGDRPVPADYDGDGRHDFAIFRPSSSTWFIQRSTAGTLIQPFGIAGDVPIQSAFIP